MIGDPSGLKVNLQRGIRTAATSSIYNWGISAIHTSICNMWNTITDGPDSSVSVAELARMSMRGSSMAIQPGDHAGLPYCCPMWALIVVHD